MSSWSEADRFVPRFRVGVTGHRTQGLSAAGYVPEKLRRSAYEVLARVQRIAHNARAGPTLYVVSPLAEGADQIVAEEGLTLGFRLQSPLPFRRHEYEKDFATLESRAAFDALLDRASEVIELSGSRIAANQAYEDVGRWVLRHSDILIAIWNGMPAAGKGGTGQIVEEAITEGLPTLWIPPHDPISILRSTNPIISTSINRLSDEVHRVLDSKA